MKKLFISHWVAGASLALLVLVLVLINYRPGAILSGWDNLHSDFNCQMNLKRALFSGWQEYQGLGLPAGHGHASDLPREALLCSLGVIFPQVDLRYVFYSISLFVGALGIYFLTFLFFKNRLCSFLGSLFYLLHIGAIQLLFTPYEAFLVYYALLPWMIASVFAYLRRPNKKRLFMLFIIHIFGSSQFYIPTLFIVYMMVLGIIYIGHMYTKRSLKEVVSSAIAIGISNLYWLSLFIYYTFSNISSQTGAQVNFLYSEDVFLKNFEFGNLKSLILFKGFLFNFTGLVDNSYGFILKNWITHFNQSSVVVIGYVLFFIVCIGFISSVLFKNKRIFSLLFLCFFTLLALDTAPFSYINSFLHSNSLFHQVFRNPFTKFGNTLLLCEAVLFVQGLHAILQMLHSLTPKRTIIVQKIVYCVIFLILFFIYSLPVWRGNLLYSQLFVTYPKEYQQLFSYFNNKPPGRIANFPQYAIDGWTTYSWGYYGSGFLWYGIEQPILDRAFDVWNPKNEQYYWEISQALYSKNALLLEKVFDKYDISSIILDKSIVGSYSPHALYIDEFIALLKQCPHITFQTQFGNILLYKNSSPSQSHSFIQSYTQINKNDFLAPWYWEDKTFQLESPYTTDQTVETTGNHIIVPFQGVFTNRNTRERNFTIEETNSDLQILSQMNNNFSGVLHVPKNNQPLEYVDRKSLLASLGEEVVVLANHQKIATNAAQFGATVPLKSLNTISVSIPKMEGLYSYKLEKDLSLLSSPAKNCNTLNNGYLSKEALSTVSETQLQLTSIHSNNCLEIALAEVPQNKAYIIMVKSEHFQGTPLLLRITNNSSRRIELETYLSDTYGEQKSYFILPPREPYGLGYTISLDNISLLHNEITINSLIDLQVFQFPYDFITNIYFSQKNVLPSTPSPSSSINNVIHDNTSQYIVELNTMKVESILELTQSYNVGWSAYPIAVNPNNPILSQFKLALPFLFAPPLKHFELNGWSNGWIVPGNLKTKMISIIYLPQFLEYLGITIAFVYCMGLIFTLRRR